MAGGHVALQSEMIQEVRKTHGNHLFAPVPAALAERDRRRWTAAVSRTANSAIKVLASLYLSVNQVRAPLMSSANKTGNPI